MLGKCDIDYMYDCTLLTMALVGTCDNDVGIELIDKQ